MTFSHIDAYTLIKGYKMAKKHHIAQKTMSQAVDLAMSRLYIPKGVAVSKTKAKTSRATHVASTRVVKKKAR